MVIGMVIFAGVMFSTFMTLFIVPTAYGYLARGTGSPEKRSRALDVLEEEVPYVKGESQI
jgi:multidrug efflux pump